VFWVLLDVFCYLRLLHSRCYSFRPERDADFLSPRCSRGPSRYPAPSSSGISALAGRGVPRVLIALHRGSIYRSSRRRSSFSHLSIPYRIIIPQFVLALASASILPLILSRKRGMFSSVVLVPKELRVVLCARVKPFVVPLLRQMFQLHPVLSRSPRGLRLKARYRAVCCSFVTSFFVLGCNRTGFARGLSSMVLRSLL